MRSVKKPVILTIATDSAPQYDVVIGRDVRSDAVSRIRKALGRTTKRLLIVTDGRVGRLYLHELKQLLAASGFEVFSHQFRGGESSKTIRTTESILRALAENNLSRDDAVVALGGGVVGDLAGFAASIYLRGIRYFQIPTTLLAMVDSSVGGKTGVDLVFGKNLVGAFWQPAGVLVDVSYLDTLSSRDLTSGLAEMVKHSALCGKGMLKQTAQTIEAVHLAERASLAEGLIGSIAANIEFKASIVGRDERESTRKRGSTSRKILNFGHTLAHALETATGYKYFRHGEAVLLGMRFALEISKKVANCPSKDVNLLYDVLHRAGPTPSIADIDPSAVLSALRFDKKSQDGELSMVLLRGIGKPDVFNIGPVAKTSVERPLIEFLEKES